MWDWKVKTAKQKEKHDWVEYEPTYGDDEDEELHVDDGNWKNFIGGPNFLLNSYYIIRVKCKKLPEL